MSRVVLPFERAFRNWVDEREMGWQKLSFSFLPGSEPTTGYRFSPAGRARRVVVTLHGAGNDALFAWVGLFKRLLQEGTEVFTFDLPGHGRENRTTFEPELAAPAVLAALETCRRAKAVPVHAVGVSLGGAVLLHALPRIQHHLASAALLVAPLRIELNARSLIREIGVHTVRLVWREREHYGLTGLIPSFGPFKRDVYPLRLRVRHPGPFGYVRCLNEDLDQLALEDAAGRVTIPTLLLYGERDLIVPAEQGRRLARAMDRVTYHEVPGGTHLSTPLETEATDRLIRWLEEQT
jgi:acylglycerol lipase